MAGEEEPFWLDCILRSSDEEGDASFHGSEDDDGLPASPKRRRITRTAPLVPQAPSALSTHLLSEHEPVFDVDDPFWDALDAGEPGPRQPRGDADDDPQAVTEAEGHARPITRRLAGSTPGARPAASEVPHPWLAHDIQPEGPPHLSQGAGEESEEYMRFLEGLLDGPPAAELGISQPGRGSGDEGGEEGDADFQVDLDELPEEGDQADRRSAQERRRTRSDTIRHGTVPLAAPEWQLDVADLNARSATERKNVMITALHEMSRVPVNEDDPTPPPGAHPTPFPDTWLAPRAWTPAMLRQLHSQVHAHTQQLLQSDVRVRISPLRAPAPPQGTGPAVADGGTAVAPDTYALSMLCELNDRRDALCEFRRRRGLPPHSAATLGVCPLPSTCAECCPLGQWLPMTSAAELRSVLDVELLLVFDGYVRPHLPAVPASLDWMEVGTGAPAPGMTYLPGTPTPQSRALSSTLRMSCPAPGSTRYTTAAATLRLGVEHGSCSDFQAVCMCLPPPMLCTFNWSLAPQVLLHDRPKVVEGLPPGYQTQNRQLRLRTFTPSEDERIAQAVLKYGSTGWERIQEELAGPPSIRSVMSRIKNAGTVRTRALRSSCNAIARAKTFVAGPLTEQEVAVLMWAKRVHPSESAWWKSVCARYLPHRTHSTAARMFGRYQEEVREGVRPPVEALHPGLAWYLREAWGARQPPEPDRYVPEELWPLLEFPVLRVRERLPGARPDLLSLVPASVGPAPPPPEPPEAYADAPLGSQGDVPGENPRDRRLYTRDTLPSDDSDEDSDAAPDADQEELDVSPTRPGERRGDGGALDFSQGLPDFADGDFEQDYLPSDDEESD